MATSGQHDVGGFEVAVDDPLPVSSVEGFGNLSAVDEHITQRQRPVSQAAASVSPSRYSIRRKSIPFSPQGCDRAGLSLQPLPS
jgi:hypothetical protein